MEPILRHLAQGSIVLVMLVVGLELTRHDFARVLEAPRTILLATLAQIALLPVLGFLVVILVQPPPAVALGIVLLAACPGGAFSNLYTSIVRADVALSVTLTAVSTLLAAIYLPLLLPPLLALLDYRANGALVSGPRLLIMLLATVVLPVLMGMALRHFRPGIVRRWQPALRGLSLLAIVVLLGRAIVESGGLLGAVARSAAAIGVLFTATAFLAGLGFAMLLTGSPRARVAIGIEFAVRNIPIAILVASAVLPDPRLVAFAAAYFVVHAPIIVGLAALAMRLHRQPQTAPAAST